MLDVTQLMFFVDDDGSVSLNIGAVSVKVCESAEDFGEFQQRLVEQLDMIRHELFDNYIEGKAN